MVREVEPGEVSLTRHEIGEGGARLTIHDVDEDGDQDIMLSWR